MHCWPAIAKGRVLLVLLMSLASATGPAIWALVCLYSLRHLQLQSTSIRPPAPSLICRDLLLLSALLAYQLCWYMHCQAPGHALLAMAVIQNERCRWQ